MSKNNAEANLTDRGVLHKWLNALRWILVLPVSIVSSILVAAIFYWLASLFTYIDTGTLQGMVVRLVQSFFIGASFVYIGSLLAPKKHLIVSVVLLFIITIGVTFITTILLFSEGINLLYVLLTSLVLLLGGGSMVYGINDELKYGGKKWKK